MAIKKIKLDTSGSGEFVLPKGKIQLDTSSEQPIQFNQEEPQQEDSYLQSAGRIGRGLGEAAVTGFGSVPKGIAETVDVAQNLGSKVQDYLGTSPKQSPKQEEFNRMIEEKGLDNRSMAARLGEALPSSKDIRETIGSEYTKPRNQYEQLGQDVSETIGSLLFPLPGGGIASEIKTAAQGAKKLGALATSKAFGKIGAKVSGGDLAKFLTQKLGGSEELGNKVKVGTMLGLNWGLGPQYEDKAKEIYSYVDKNTPKSLRVGVPKTEKAMEEAYKLANKGNWDLSEKIALNKHLDRISSKIKDGKSALSEIIAEKRDVAQTVLEDFKKGSPAEAAYYSLASAFNQDIKNNPQVPKKIAEGMKYADEIYTGLSQQKRAIQYVENNTDLKKILGPGGMTILISNLFANSGLKNTVKTLATSVALPLAAKQATKIGYGAKNILFNPSIRNEAVKVFGAALKENSPLLVKHAKSFVDKMEKEQKKEGYQWEPVNENESYQWEAV